jgi:hypothetical protein
VPGSVTAASRVAGVRAHGKAADQRLASLAGVR